MKTNPIWTALAAVVALGLSSACNQHGHDHPHGQDHTHGDDSHGHAHDGDSDHGHAHDGDSDHGHAHDGDSDHGHAHDGDSDHGHAHDGDSDHGHAHDSDSHGDHAHSHGHGHGGDGHGHSEGFVAQGEVVVFEPDPREKHFSELKRLTALGENAEAYFSFDGSKLVYQSTSKPYQCDQIFVMSAQGGQPELVSTGKGRTTCAYFTPDDRSVVYSSTHLGGEACPPEPDRSQGYVWALYPSFDIFRVSLEDAAGKRAAPTRLTDTPGYDAEATISPKGDRIVFTSTRDGDLDIYTMKLDGSDVKRLTDALGYDGGPFYSPDGTKIVYRAHHPKTAEETADYKRLLGENLIRPSRLEIWVMNADGSNKQQITELNAAAFGPFFHPSGKKILFSSNHHDPRGREFDLFMVDASARKAGPGDLEQITFSEQFDGFPMFSPDGKWLAFASNRHNQRPRDTNVYVTRWKD